MHFTGGFAGEPGPNDTRGNSAGYLAGQGLEILDHNIVHDFRYELVLGSLGDIRARAATHRPQGLPQWTFTEDRQGWHFQNASDTGWPLREHLEVLLERNDPQVISPMVFWQAQDAPYLIIDAAFHTGQKEGVVMWQPHGQTGFSAGGMAAFPVMADGEFHRHVIHLASAPTYVGGMLRLRIDPVGGGEAGAWVKVRSVRLAAKPE